MAFEGKFWLLWEEEPIDVDHSRMVALRDGVVFDGRTGNRRGTYVEGPNSIDIVFNEEAGECYVAKMHMWPTTEIGGDRFVQIEPAFDPNADGYSVTWSTMRFEAYLAARPLIKDEDDELRFEREHAEGVLFGLVPTYGAALRDGSHIREMHDENKREASAADPGVGCSVR